jgi:hypothetical protein
MTTAIVRFVAFWPAVRAAVKEQHISAANARMRYCGAGPLVAQDLGLTAPALFASLNECGLLMATHYPLNPLCCRADFDARWPKDTVWIREPPKGERAGGTA